MSAGLLILLVVLALAGRQALQIARQDADAALHVQASAQLAALSQLVAHSASRGDYGTVQTQLKVPIAEGNLLFVEYTAPNGYTIREQTPSPNADRPGWFAALADLDVPVLQQTLVVGGADYGRLLIQPSSRP